MGFPPYKMSKQRLGVPAPGFRVSCRGSPNAECALSHSHTVKRFGCWRTGTSAFFRPQARLRTEKGNARWEHHTPTPDAESGGSLPAALFRKPNVTAYFHPVNGFGKSVTEVQEKRDIWKIGHNNTTINRNFAFLHFRRSPAADSAFRSESVRPVPPCVSGYW